MKAVVVALLAIGLAGCEALLGEFETLGENAPAQDVEKRNGNVMAVEPESAEVVPAASESADTTPAPLPPRPESKPAVTTVAFDKLTGLTPRQSERLLGPPDHRSEDPPATVWTYEIGDCRLEMFFYFDLESQQQRSLAYDVYVDSEAQGADALCLVQLAQRGERQRPLEELLEGVNSLPPSADGESLSGARHPVQGITDAGEAHETGEGTESE